ncbi:MAG: DUF748 domain-containing protein [Opitutales bacterium]
MPIRLTRWRKRLLGALVVMSVLYVAGGFLLTPSLIRWFILPLVNEQLNGEVQIESIAINPLRLSGTLEGLQVVDTAGAVVLSADRAYANLQISSLFQFSWNAYKIELVKPEVFAVLDAEGDLNLLGLVKESEEPKPDQPITVPPAKIGTFTITDAGLHFRDERFADAFTQSISPLTLSIEAFDTHPENDNPYHVVASAASGERIEWTGTLRFDPLSSEGTLSVSGFSPVFYSPLYQRLLPFVIDGGTAAFETTYAFAPLNDPPLLRADVQTASLTGLSLRERGARTPFFTEGAIEIENAEADLYAATVGAASLKVSDGYLRIERRRNGRVPLLQMVEAFMAPSGDTKKFAFKAAADAEVRTQDAEPATDVSADPTTPDLEALDLREPVNVAIDQLQNLATLPWLAYLDHLELQSQRIEILDRVPATPARIDMELASFVASGIETAPEADIQFELNYRLGREGQLRAQGDVRPFQQEVDYTFTATDIPMGLVEPYVTTLLKVSMQGGWIDASGDTTVRPGETLPLVTSTTHLQVRDFSLSEQIEESELLGFDQIRVRDLIATSEPLEARIARIEVDGARATVVRQEDGALLVTQLPRFTREDFSEETDPDNLSPQATSQAQGLQIITHALLDIFQQWESFDAPVNLTLDRLIVRDAAATLDDRSAAAKATVTQVQADVRNLTTVKSQRAPFDIRGIINEDAVFTVQGEISPLKQDRYTQVEATLEPLELMPFTGYAGQFVGFELDTGAASAKLNYRLNQSILEGDNHLEIDQLRFGEPTDSPDAIKLPVKLGVALLKDSRGKIVLDVPIRGDLSDPNFSLGPVIAQAFKAILTRVVSSPFKFLGGIVGGEAEDMEDLGQLLFLPGESAVTQKAVKKLGVLSKALKQRPELNLVVLPEINVEQDRAGLRKALLREHFINLKRERLEAEGKAPGNVKLSVDEYDDAVRAAYQRLFVNVDTSGDPVFLDRLDTPNEPTQPAPKNLPEPEAQPVTPPPAAEAKNTEVTEPEADSRAEALQISEALDEETRPFRGRRAGPRFSPGIRRPSRGSEAAPADSQPSAHESAVSESGQASADAAPPTPADQEPQSSAPEPSATASGTDESPDSLPTEPVPLPPLDQMEAALLEAVPVSDEDLRALAASRANAVARRFVESGQIDEARIRVRLPKADAPLSEDGQSRVQFSLE